MRKTKWQGRVLTIAGFTLVAGGGLAGCGEETGSDSGGSSSGGDGGSAGSQSYNSDAFPECWNRVWENCFDAAGACMLSGFDISWENGAAVSTTVAGTTGSSTSTYVSSSGETCATIEQDIDLAAGTSVATVMPGNGDADFTYTVDADGNFLISCGGEDFTVELDGAGPAMASGDDCEVDTGSFFGDGGFDFGSFLDAGTGGGDEDASAGGSDEDAGSGAKEDAGTTPTSGDKPTGLTEACSQVYDLACTQGCSDGNVDTSNQCEWARTNQDGYCCATLPGWVGLADYCGWGTITTPDSCN